MEGAKFYFPAGDLYVIYSAGARVTGAFEQKMRDVTYKKNKLFKR